MNHVHIAVHKLEGRLYVWCAVLVVLLVPFQSLDREYYKLQQITIAGTADLAIMIQGFRGPTSITVL